MFVFFFIQIIANPQKIFVIPVRSVILFADIRLKLSRIDHPVFLAIQKVFLWIYAGFIFYKTNMLTLKKS